MSKGLEAFVRLEHNTKRYKGRKEDLDTIFQELKEYEKKKNHAIEVVEEFFNKELKALEIIKEKRVNIGDFIRTRNVEQYNDYLAYNDNEKLTQEEYDLLKEVMS